MTALNASLSAANFAFSAFQFAATVSPVALIS